MRMSSVSGTSVCNSRNSRNSRRFATRCFVALFIAALCRSGAALCAEQAPLKIQVAPTLSTSSLPPSFTTLGTLIPEERTFSTTEFSPRRLGILGSRPAPRTQGDAPRMTSRTVWQHLNEYRTRDRVRLVTLWESSESSLSLQAGKKGDASLQWTSKWLNRGGATRGLLDTIVAAALTSAATRLRSGNARGSGGMVAAAPPPRATLGLGLGLGTSKIP